MVVCYVIAYNSFGNKLYGLCWSLLIICTSGFKLGRVGPIP